MASEMDEIWSLYEDDGGESLRTVEEALEALQREPSNADQIAALFRAMHTFKGNSRLLTLVNIEQLAHLAEDLVGLVRDEGVAFDAEIGAALIEASDQLRSMMESAVARRADVGENEGASTKRRLQRIFDARRGGQGPAPLEATAEPEQTIEEPSDTVVYFEATEQRLADDPVYLQIFLEFALEALTQLDRAEPDAVAELASGLAEMAERIGLEDWRDAALSVGAAFNDAERASAMAALRGLFPAALRGPGKDAFGARAASLVKALARDSVEPREISPDIAEAARNLAELARGREVHAVVEIAERLAAASNHDAVTADLFALYEALRLWRDSGEDEIAPALEGLGAWCVAQGASTLARLALAIHGRPNDMVDWAEIEVLIKQFGCVCHSHGLPAATDVAALLGDLVARARSGELQSDARVTRVIASFVEAAKPLITRAGGGDVADPARFAETSSALADLCRPREVSDLAAQMNIPSAFLPAMTPENVDVAQLAAREGLRFHVIRARTERRPETAEPFFHFLSSVKVVSTLTVFDDDATSFDLLIATRDDADAVKQALAAINPQGDALELTVTLTVAAPEAPIPEDETLQPQSAARVLESLGEVVTAQASARQLLQRIADGDIPAAFDRALRVERDEALQDWKNDFEQLVQLQNQIGDSLERLQHAVLSSQLRPGEPLLRKLRELALQEANRRGRALNVEIAGAEEPFDVEILASLGRVAPSLASAAGVNAERLSIRLTQTENRVTLAFEISGGGPPPEDELARAASELAALGGEAKRIGGPAVGFALSLPRALALLDGMVLRIGAIRYAVPIRSVQRILHSRAADLVPISAWADQSMLRVGKDVYVAVARLAHETSTPLTAMDGEAHKLFALIVDDGELAALAIDEIIGQQPLLVRPLDGCLSAIRGAAGCAVLADGSVGVVLDPAELVARQAA